MLVPQCVFLFVLPDRLCRFSACVIFSACAGVCDIFSKTHYRCLMSYQSNRSRGSAWVSEDAFALSLVSPSRFITGKRAKRANVHKQGAKVCIYMLTSLFQFILFLSFGVHDPRPFQNNTELTSTLFSTFLSTLSLFPSNVCLCSLHEFLLLISSSSASFKVVQLINIIQTCDSTNLSMPFIISHVVLPLPLLHLLLSSIHPPTDCHPLSQS